jgi:oligoribonuclease (3'-5' exoribonuclease)
VPINYFIGWVGFTKKQADYYEIKYTRLKQKLEEKKDFNTDTCTKDELIARCRELGLNEENTNLAIEFFIKKTKQSELADKLCVDEKSIQQSKRRLKQKLNNK